MNAFRRANYPKSNITIFKSVIKFILVLSFASASILWTEKSLRADTIDGMNDPRFQAALSMWLDNEDLAALKALATLAREQNRAGQVLLGQIQDKQWLHDHVTRDLDRKARIELLREPVGLSGRSWLKSAASDVPLAQLLLDADRIYEDSSVALALLDRGEIDAALSIIERAWEIPDPLIALEIALHDQALPYATGIAYDVIEGLPRYVAIKWVTPEDTRLARLQEPARRLPPKTYVDEILWTASPFQDVEPGSKELRKIGEQLANAQYMKPVVRVIEHACPDSVPETLAALQYAQFGKPLTLLTLSPLETLIPTEKYQKSRRYVRDLVRRMGFSVKHWHHLQRFGPCAFEGLKSWRR